MTANWRPTKVQADVIQRMREGWELLETPDGPWIECKRGEPNRHVASVTVESLKCHGLIRRSVIHGAFWVLAQPQPATRGGAE